MLKFCLTLLIYVSAIAHASPLLFSLFENSLRRDPVGVEAQSVVRIGNSVGPSCSAFFIENSDDTPLVGTANHCFNYSLRSMCGPNVILYDQGRHPIGQCEEVLLQTPAHDFVLFRAKMFRKLQQPPGLKLAQYDPPVWTPLKEIGYPADTYRDGKITVSDNCWSLGPAFRHLQLPWRWDREGARDFVTRMMAHNCSTYGGNSGGPILHLGSTIVVGLPDVYFENDFTLHPSDGQNKRGELALISDFVQLHQKKLKELGVALVDKAPALPSHRGAYLSGVVWGQIYRPIHHPAWCSLIPRWNQEQDTLEMEMVNLPGQNCGAAGEKSYWTCQRWPNRVCFQQGQEASSGRQSLVFENGRWHFYLGNHSTYQSETYDLYRPAATTEEKLPPAIHPRFPPVMIEMAY